MTKLWKQIGCHGTGERVEGVHKQKAAGGSCSDDRVL